MPTVPTSGAPPGCSGSGFARVRIALPKKLCINNGGTDQKMMHPSVSAVTMRGASRKYLQQVAAWLCLTSQPSELATCFPKSQLYQRISPSSDAPTIISPPSWAICTMPALLTSILFRTIAFLGSRSSWTLISFSAADRVKTFPGIVTICVTSWVCGVNLFNAAPQEMLRTIISPSSAPTKTRRSPGPRASAVMFCSMTRSCV
mmetsp:Transcript_35904/g.78634  ORF Transcript_35904/g.78634 Transcript_35904/m.78634 type:complete len:203 (+) Transcript_35904:976-1584(+)